MPATSHTEWSKFWLPLEEKNTKMSVYFLEHYTAFAFFSNQPTQFNSNQTGLWFWRKLGASEDKWSKLCKASHSNGERVCVADDLRRREYNILDVYDFFYFNYNWMPSLTSFVIIYVSQVKTV